MIGAPARGTRMPTAILTPGMPLAEAVHERRRSGAPCGAGRLGHEFTGRHRDDRAGARREPGGDGDAPATRGVDPVPGVAGTPHWVMTGGGESGGGDGTGRSHHPELGRDPAGACCPGGERQLRRPG
jgi:hypothetical protein